LESTPRIKAYEKLTDRETFELLLEKGKALNVVNKLSGFRVVANHIADDKGKVNITSLRWI
jgi:putative GTP pyrophosphokinase